MNPSDANSSLATLRQLKEMLDAGALTPQEFEILKQKLLFGKDIAPNDGIPAPASKAAAFGPPAAVSEALTSAPSLPGEVSMPLPTVEMPDWLATPASSLSENPPAAPAESDYPEDDVSPAEGQRGSLNLLFAIGGALVFLAVVLYLTLGNRGSDEHLTSTTQTAADSTAVAPEVGPQAQQLTLPPAAPETVRVAPVVPPVVAPAATRSTSADSAVAPASSAPASPPTKPVTKPAPTTTVAADSAI